MEATKNDWQTKITAINWASKKQRFGLRRRKTQLNIHEFIIADNEKAARIYFKDLVFNDFGRLAYDSKKVKKYNEARYNEN